MKLTDWASVAANSYNLPEGLYPPDALPELLGMLASPDPTVRDEQAYMTLSEWTQAGHFDAVLAELGARTTALLRAPDILSRSFSALILGEAVRRDTNLLREQGKELAFRLLWYPSALAAWHHWYPNEADVRSFEEGTGWIHTVAHGADTALALALHPQASAADLQLILDTLTARLRSLPLYLSQTEDDRLALAVLAVLSRPEVTVEYISSWLENYQTLWASSAAGLIPAGPVLAVRTLHSLHTLLHLGATLGDVTLHPAYSAETLELVQEALRSIYPYYGQP
ncbi:DUF2785 domain-containing protein [Deinococcus detaillensis]|uniref:DUF2785 domain-containing protein n=1 Tax=Deinococcus detaillensis TaxID=2592048 RepID=A0A553V295_9DEIO|nr:DUF2785 domain-containing protein [Deinococcus detaillensis]TSA86351.1 DUF2785 domain-containing protein [Deinococcus detaillensis]